MEPPEFPPHPNFFDTDFKTSGHIVCTQCVWGQGLRSCGGAPWALCVFWALGPERVGPGLVFFWPWPWALYLWALAHLFRSPALPFFPGSSSSITVLFI